MTIKDIALASIGHEYGWAVADMFEQTFDNPNAGAEHLNVYAAKYIHRTVRDLISSGALSKEAQGQLTAYAQWLETLL